MTTQRPEENKTKFIDLPATRQRLFELQKQHQKVIDETVRFCDACGLFFKLKSESGSLLCLYETQDLSMCPDCGSPLRIPNGYECYLLCAYPENYVRSSHKKQGESVLAKYCLQCGKELTGKQTKFCSRACKDGFHYHQKE